MTLRFAQIRDIPGMIRLLQQVGAVHHDIRPDLFRGDAQKYSEEDLAKLLQDASRPILIAEKDGNVAGYCFCILQITENNPVLCDRKVLYIDDLCVEETLRGTGIAKLLYHRALDYARELGCDAVTLNVWSGNPAQGFYERMGMKPQKVGMEVVL